MRVFLTGASGFVGSSVLTHLIRSHHEVTCLIRPGSEKKLPVFPSDRVNLVYGNLTKQEDWQTQLTGCGAVIHLVGIIRDQPKSGISFETIHVEGTRNMLAAATSAGVNRFIHMSALGARAGAPSRYHDTKGRADDLVKASGLDWTLFKPSIIFGPKDEFVNMLAGLIQKAPFAPVPGNGLYKLQPVGLQNIADGFVRSLTNDSTIHQVYEVGGPRAYTYNRMLDIIGEAIGKKKVRKLHIPIPLMKPVAKIGEQFPSFPLTTAQLLMLLEGSTCDPSDFYRTLDLDPVPFSEGIRLYLKKPPAHA
ncbi:MAG: Nucleoside-diphosphate sugar epimerase [Bacilli bacterium]|nr:Nucleoside-diphosphate sugar epimerase [Bacilli bacterium]